MTGRYLFASAALVALLSACSSPQQQRRAQQASAAERTLDRIGSIGDPGRVAAADIAFARMARDEGQWTAYRANAASGAVVHGADGPVPVEGFIGGRTDPAVANAWTPNTIWASCDGTLAVTFGRYQVPNGDVGSYVTVWELQRDRSYKWTYDVRTLDNPQPEPEAGPDIPEGEEAIIVPGMTSIEGRVADCMPQGTPPPPDPPAMASDSSGGDRSTDARLEWSWAHQADGTRHVNVSWLREGEWQQAVSFSVPPGAE